MPDREVTPMFKQSKTGSGEVAAASRSGFGTKTAKTAKPAKQVPETVDRTADAKPASRAKPAKKAVTAPKAAEVVAEVVPEPQLPKPSNRHKPGYQRRYHAALNRARIELAARYPVEWRELFEKHKREVEIEDGIDLDAS